MNVRFFYADKKREEALCHNFLAGLKHTDDVGSAEPLSATPNVEGINVACMVGVKSRRLFQRCLEANVVPVIFDKGYIRSRRDDARVWLYWRVSVGAHHPTRFLGNPMPAARFDELDLKVERWRKTGFQIVLAGSSQKYHDFYGLPDPTEWARNTVRKLRKLTDRPIIYRPKPSWHEAVPIEGTHFSKPTENIDHVLSNAWALVTHGSNACFEAAIAGIPSIVLGDAVARPISSTSLDEVENPVLGERGPWLKELAYWQWTEKEMARGLAWEFLKGKVTAMIEGKVKWPI